MCETTSLIEREVHYVQNYVPHTKGRTLCVKLRLSYYGKHIMRVKLRLSYYGKNIMCETTSIILREEHYVWNYVSNTKRRTLAECVREEGAEKDILI